MPISSFSSWSTTAASNTDVGGISILGTAPVSNFDGAVREVMAQLKSGVPAKVGTSTDNALVRFDGTSGQHQNSTAILADDGSLSLNPTTTVGLTQSNTGPTSASTADFTNDAGAGLHWDVYGSSYAAGTQFGIGASGTAFYADTKLAIGTSNNNDVQFFANSAYVGRFTSSSKYFLVGATASSFATVEAGVLVDPAGGISLKRAGTGTNAHAIFANNAAVTPTQVGSITTNGSTTTYNTSSDERLKEGFADFDSGAIIDAISVYRYSWRIDGSEGYGPKAQELHGVFPIAVTEGSHEGPGEEGFVPWSYDASKLVPILIREVQRLRKRVEALER